MRGERCSSRHTASVRGRPNILLIITDQERCWDTLPADLELPARERLKRGGIHFINYHVNAVACSPSRSAIYTGQHVQRTRVFDNAGEGLELDPQRTATIGHMLQRQGYCTVYAGKWHLSADSVFRRAEKDLADALTPYGFEHYRPIVDSGDSYGEAQEGASADASLALWGRDWLAGKVSDIAQGRPWFLALNFVNPHDIMFFDATGRQSETQLAHWARMKIAPKTWPYSEDLGFDLPRSFTADLSDKPAVHRAFIEDAALTFGEMPHQDRQAWRRYQNYYFNCLRDGDRHIGTILDALEKSGSNGNTVVIFSSDHGELAGAHGMRGKGPVVYRENFAVPLIIRHPDVHGGSQSSTLMCAVDLAPTILGLTGLDGPATKEIFPDLVGYDMSESIADCGASGARAVAAGGILLTSSIVHASNPATTRQLAQPAMDDFVSKLPKPASAWPRGPVDAGLKSFLRGYYDGRYRFARYFEPGDDHLPRDWQTLVGRNELELYDTLNDVDEMANLAAAPETHQPLLLELNARLNALIEGEEGPPEEASAAGGAPAAQ